MARLDPSGGATLRNSCRYTCEKTQVQQMSRRMKTVQFPEAKI